MDDRNDHAVVAKRHRDAEIDGVDGDRTITVEARVQDGVPAQRICTRAREDR